MKKLVLGKIYEITVYDHFTNSNLTPQQMSSKEFQTLTFTGKYVAHNKKYYFLSPCYDEELSDNCDCQGLMRNCIKEVKELRR